ncbi:MAG TPA: TrmH family RNA methyltransferase [Candidatus Limnocylindrales bacterium]|nr:TrmH family RNA methyltransferase [Candidatus Limnocylindrales bacterium]
MSRRVALIVHNVRSCHNVGSLLRTAEGLGLEMVYLTGYTPYPLIGSDERLPHIALKSHRQIEKTALGAELTLPWRHRHEILTAIAELRQAGFVVAGLEQTAQSINLTTWVPPQRVAIIVGRETFGMEPETLQLCDTVVEIPMRGRKESFNVVQAAAMALYHCVFAK